MRRRVNVVLLRVTRESLSIRLKSRGAGRRWTHAVPELRGREAGTVLARLRRADDRGSLTTERRPCAELHRGEIVVLRLFALRAAV